MAVATGTPYQQMLDAVAAYYGSGSDQWYEVAKYGMAADDFEKIIDSLPGYRCVVNDKGKVLGYEKFDIMNSSNGVATEINSNVQGATTKTKIATPATTGVNPTTQKVTATKGISTSSGLQFISKEVVPAICAASVGISLGKTIDKALYNANPDFWNSIGMQSLDPSTWGDITTGMNGSLSAGLFNTLFGINPNNGRGQMYIDQNAYAYLALYLSTLGVFDDVSETNIGEIPADFQVTDPIIRGVSKYSITDIQSQYDSDAGTWVDMEFLTRYEYEIMSSSSNTYATGMLKVDDGHYEAKIVIASDAPFTYRHKNQTFNITKGTATEPYYGETSSSRDFTYNNHTVYYGFFSTLGGGVGERRWVEIIGAQSNYLNIFSGFEAELAYMMVFSQYDGTAVEGIGNQTGATLPLLDPNATVAQTLAALQQQYPGLFNNAVTYPVVQKDGTTVDYKYIPVPYPTVSGKNDTKPTGGADNSNQARPYYDPATDTGGFWRNIYDIYDFDDYDGDDETGGGDTPTPVLPGGSASALFKIYNPSQSQLDAFGAWLWSPAFVDQILKLFSDPMQAIIGLHKVFATPSTSGSGPIKVGYLTSSASANYVSNQYTSVDCGSVKLDEKFGNIFDYPPYTKISIYLPFIGFRDLDANDIMRGTISVVYHVDVLTGACLAEVKVNRDNAGGTVYTFSGNCAVQYPVSSGSYIGILTGALGVAASLASGGSALPALMRAGSHIGAMHTNVEHSGNLSGNSGAMGIKKPYLFISRAQSKMPVNGNLIEGLPENKTVALNQISGFVRVKKCHYDGIPCTANELDRIKELLENGIYIN